MECYGKGRVAGSEAARRAGVVHEFARVGSQVIHPSSFILFTQLDRYVFNRFSFIHNTIHSIHSFYTNDCNDSYFYFCLSKQSERYLLSKG